MVWKKVSHSYDLFFFVGNIFSLMLFFFRCFFNLVDVQHNHLSQNVVPNFHPRVYLLSKSLPLQKGTSC